MGPECEPADLFKEATAFEDKVNSTFNQDGAESCDCMNRGIRLAIVDQGLDEAQGIVGTSTQSKAVKLPEAGPCLFRRSYFAWDIRGTI